MGESASPKDTLGTLSDFEIRDLCQVNKLITKNFSDESIKQACYELRASNRYYEIDRNGVAKPVDLQDKEYILIKPNQSVVIISLEHLILPNNILGRVLSKGKLFSLGLLPVNTYADPGFDGELGIVMFNSSQNYLKIYPGEAIAKIEFCRLSHSVERPYHGQHGHGTGVWVVPTQMILTKQEVLSDSRIGSIYDELRQLQGSEIADAVKNLELINRQLIISSCIFFVLCAILISSIIYVQESFSLAILVGVAVGVLSNLVYGLLVHRNTKILGGPR